MKQWRTHREANAEEIDQQQIMTNMNKKKTRRSTAHCLLFFFLLQFSSTNAHPVVFDEAAALLSLKSTLVDPLGRLDDWHASSPHCNWTGVGCNPSGSGHVDTLDLSHLNLSGHITNDGLRHLPDLRHLDFSSNLLSGEFSHGLTGLLRTLNASGNDFTGRLPEDLGNGTSLEVLDLRGSFFDGPIPATYGNLKELTFLGLSGNNLTGRLPPELGRLSSLETLIIGYNGLEGPVPAELGNLTKLRYLDMAVGSIGGAIPPELGRLQLLTTLYLYSNELEGEIPVEIGNMSSLVSLDLSDNRITGRIPPELGNLGKLRLLNLMGNRLVGAFPSAIGELKELEVLSLWNNSLTGELPASLGRASPLQWLDVSSNTLTGMIPEGLCRGGNVTKLILFGNGFTGPMPASLADCRSLVRLRVQNNRLNGSIPTGFGRLPAIHWLELAGNELSGAIPGDISESTTLSFVDLSGNRLESTLPPDLLAIPTLQSFVASSNMLTGGVPDRFQDCPVLAVLDLSSNRLTGGIPENLASCGRLVDLNLSNNSLTGKIPGSLATMASVSVLDLHNNELTGGIPPDLGSSPALETVNLANNSLTGPVPNNGVLKTINPTDLSGNPGLCGGLLLPSCDDRSSWPGSSGGGGLRARNVLSGWAIGISTVAGAALLAVASRWVHRNWWHLWRREGKGKGEGEGEAGDGEWPWRLTAFQRVGFTGAEVAAACAREENVVGMGATGVVYRAEVGGWVTVAVKRLWGAAASGEVDVLGRLRHRNVVRLLGVVGNGGERTMLVYEYVEKGSLWDALHGKGEELGDWVARYKVAVGVAQGLAYLHYDCHPPVIHRDVKSSNILLDGEMEARIADFGLARAIVTGRNETLSRVAGSHGYIAPECGYTLKVDQKSDIYSFGVVLMELLTGRKPIEPEFADCQDLVGWVREKLRCSSPVEDVLDPTVSGHCQHIQEEMVLVLRLAVLCTARVPKDRPSMRDVVTMLDEAKPRRKSSSTTSAATASASKEKPAFRPSPGPDYAFVTKVEGPLI